MSSSQRHRPGATVSLSATAYAREKMKRVDNLEGQLNSLSPKKNDNEASRLRMRLCEILSDVILTEPLYSTTHDCIGRLWRSCFYGPIGVLRSRITKEKKKKGPNVAKLEKSLTQFIAEAVTLYNYLVAQYHSKLLPSEADATPGSQESFSQASFNDSQPAPSTSPAGVVPGLFRMYIHMGDLFRYDGKFTKSQDYYAKASKLSPGRGNPYNQIAVVAQLKDSNAPLNAAALYWYARSLLTTLEPFEIAKANLSRLFQSNREWFQKQPTPPLDDVSSKKEMAKAQRSKAVSHYLSQLVDLHYSFFQGINAASEMGEQKEGATPTAAVSEEDVVKQMEAALPPLVVLLRNSAFSDALICKMVAIGAFSEVYSPNGKPKSATTMMLARVFTLALGACLAERAAVGLAKIKDHPEKMANPGKSPPSVRLLLPLLLVCEYIESSPIGIDVGQNGAGSNLTPTTRAFCQKVIDSFWQHTADVMNILTTIRVSLDLNDNDDWKNASLKEFDALLGYSPFQSFLNDPMVDSREDGYASIEEAVTVLELSQSQSQSQDHLSSTQDSTSDGGGQPAEEHKVKVARFLAFGDRIAEGDDLTKVAGRRFERNPDGTYIWKEYLENDSDSPMMDVENDNDTQPIVATKASDDVLVYSVPEGGGPALLVPGMLLQNRALSNVTGDTVGTRPRAATDGSVAGPPNPLGSTDPAQVANVALASPIAMAVDPQPAQRSPPSAPAGANVMPPPGFGVGGLSGMPAVPAMPQNYVPLGSAPGAQSFTNFMPPVQAQGAAMSTGLVQGFPPMMQQQQEQYQPTLGTSMHLFGGPEALKTDNPFAAASTPSVDANGNLAMLGLNLGGTGGINGNGASFLGPSVSGVGESSLLGSGLLDSLFEDAGSKTTKNPFAT